MKEEEEEETKSINQRGCKSILKSILFWCVDFSAHYFKCKVVALISLFILLMDS